MFKLFKRQERGSTDEVYALAKEMVKTLNFEVSVMSQDEACIQLQPVVKTGRNLSGPSKSENRIFAQGLKDALKKKWLNKKYRVTEESDRHRYSTRIKILAL